MSMNDLREHRGDPKRAKKINGIEIRCYDGPGDYTRGVRSDHGGPVIGIGDEDWQPGLNGGYSIVVRRSGSFRLPRFEAGITSVEHFGHTRPEAATRQNV
jgi:hypothetical protein